ncbi:MAG TPA: hypothetical protein VEC36_13165 [Patescibacteria group bacterium]|nr:hypothetical protein [Patescibacteria group bacterium]
MKRSLQNILITSFCAMFISSCYVPDMSFITDLSSPYIFTLNKNSDMRLGGYILSDLDSVDIISDKSVKLFGGGKIILGTYRQTQFTAELHTSVLRGDGLRFILRSNPDINNHAKALQFDYTRGGSRLFKGKTQLLESNVAVRLNAPEKIRITHYADMLRVEIGCDRVFETRVSDPATEYITIESLPGTEVLFSSIILERTLPSKYFIAMPNLE